MKCTTFDEFIKEANVLKKGPDECWEWTRARNRDGYGGVTVKDDSYEYRYRLKQKNKTLVAHRFAFELFYNCRIASDLQVRHTCDNAGCVNPHHLILGHDIDNVRDCVERGRRGKPNMKVTKEQVEEMRAMRSSGMMYKDIAPKYGLHKNTVCNMLNKKGFYASTQ